METRGYPISPNVGTPTPMDASSPSVDICGAGAAAIATLEKQLNFMRSERDNISSAIREIEQRMIELSGMNKVAQAPTYPPGVR